MKRSTLLHAVLRILVTCGAAALSMAAHAQRASLSVARAPIQAPPAAWSASLEAFREGVQSNDPRNVTLERIAGIVAADRRGALASLAPMVSLLEGAGLTPESFASLPEMQRRDRVIDAYDTARSYARQEAILLLARPEAAQTAGDAEAEQGADSSVLLETAIDLEALRGRLGHFLDDAEREQVRLAYSRVSARLSERNAARLAQSLLETARALGQSPGDSSVEAAAASPSPAASSAEAALSPAGLRDGSERARPAPPAPSGGFTAEEAAKATDFLKALPRQEGNAAARQALVEGLKVALRRYLPLGTAVFAAVVALFAAKGMAGGGPIGLMLAAAVVSLHGKLRHPGRILALQEGVVRVALRRGWRPGRASSAEPTAETPPPARTWRDILRDPVERRGRLLHKELDQALASIAQESHTKEETLEALALLRGETWLPFLRETHLRHLWPLLVSEDAEVAAAAAATAAAMGTYLLATFLEENPEARGLAGAFHRLQPEAAAALEGRLEHWRRNPLR